MEQELKKISIKEVYQMLKNKQLVVPSYQRSFVWDVTQQKILIESLLQGHPIGMICVSKNEENTLYEIIDGQQRLKTIYEFIETGFRGSWNEKPLSLANQNSFLSIPISFIILSGIKDQSEVIDLFQNINTAGKMLSRQELRRAASVGYFAQMVSKVAAELYSSDTQKDFEQSIWSHFGLLTEKELKRGEDQVLIARLILAILAGRLQGRNEIQLDDVYSPNNVEFQNINTQLLDYPAQQLLDEMKHVFSIFRALPTTQNIYSLESFYILFLATFDLVVQKQVSLCDYKSFHSTINTVQTVIPKQPEIAQYEELKNYALWRLSNCFASKDTQILKIDSEFENSMRCSNIETARYEHKQGFLRLSSDRTYDKNLEEQILKTLCGMANINTIAPRFLYIGIADTLADAKRISDLDKIQPVQVAGHHIVGVERESKRMNITLEEYVGKIKDFIDNSNLSRHLIVSVLTHMEMFNYKGFLIVRLVVPPQNQLSYYGDEIYIRKHSNTIKLTNPREIIAVAQQFPPSD